MKPNNTIYRNGYTKSDYIRAQKDDYNKYKHNLPSINPIKRIKGWFNKITDRDTWSPYGMYKPSLDGTSKLNKDNLRYRIRKKLSDSLTPKGMIKAAKTAASIAAIGLAGKYILDRRRENKAYHYDMANRMFKPIPIHKSGYSNPYVKDNEKLVRGNLVRR